MTTSAPPPTETPSRSTRTPSRAPAARQFRWADRTVVPAMVLAAVLAVPVAAHAVGTPMLDLLVRAAAAAALVGLGARARRWTWFVLLGGIAVLDSRPGHLLAVAIALAIAVHSTSRGERRKSHGAAVMVIASVLLFRMPHHDDALLTAVAVGCITGPALVSGYRTLPRHRRRVVGGIVEALGAVLGIIVVLFAVAAAQSRSQVNRGLADVKAARLAAQRGNEDEAVRRLDAAAASFAASRDTLGAWWAQPARLVPVLGPQARALTDLAASGEEVTRSAGTAAEQTNYRKLRAGPGRLDLDRLVSYRRPMADLAADLARADRSVRGLDQTWLVSPLRSQVRSLSAQLGAARRDAATAQRVLRVAPDLLGADGPRRYALWFTTPAETRELGGYLGSYGELTAVDGKLDLVRSGKVTDLLPATEAELAGRRFPGEADLPVRYRYYDVPHYLGNATGTDDLRLAARTFAEVYRRAGGSPVDGVITVDPYALAGILRLTGPVQVEGLPTPLTAENAAAFLLKQQYAQLGDRAERGDVLADAMRATFDRLTHMDLPEPRVLARTLAPLVSQRRLLVSSFDEAAQTELARLHLTGDLPRAADHDWLSVTNANANPNKIDAYLTRDVRVRVRVHPETGQTTSDVTVTLRNDAPPADLPGGVTANLVGLPPGTNRTFLAIGSPLDLVSAARDGTPVALEPQADPELGITRYGTFVDIPPKSSVVLRIRLKGDLDDPMGYRLAFVDQPIAQVGQVDIEVTGAPQSAIAAARGPFRLQSYSGTRFRGMVAGGTEWIEVRYPNRP